MASAAPISSMMRVAMTSGRSALLRESRHRLAKMAAMTRTAASAAPQPAFKTSRLNTVRWSRAAAAGVARIFLVCWRWR